MMNNPPPMDWTNVLQKAIHQWLQGHDAPSLVKELSPEELAQVHHFSAKNTLNGFMYSSGVMDAFSGNAVQPWKNALKKYHQKHTILGYQHLQASLALQQAIFDSGIPVFACRGPFDALQAYGDIAARFYIDCDIFVPRQQAFDALKIAEQEGYRLNQLDHSSRFYFRHHLNWELVQQETNIRTDLHWATDHPYTPQQVAYDSFFERARKLNVDSFQWQSPSNEDWVLLTAMHLLKHAPEALSWVESPRPFQVVLQSGNMKPFLDLAAYVIRQKYEPDWDTLLERAEHWRVELSLAPGLLALERIFDFALPQNVHLYLEKWNKKGLLEITQRRPNRLVKWLQKPAIRAGFRASRLEEIHHYLYPPAAYFGEDLPIRFLKRHWYATATLTKITGAGMDWMASSLGQRLRKRACENQQPSQTLKALP